MNVGTALRLCVDDMVGRLLSRKERFLYHIFPFFLSIVNCANNTKIVNISSAEFLYYVIPDYRLTGSVVKKYSSNMVARIERIVLRVPASARFDEFFTTIIHTF